MPRLILLWSLIGAVALAQSPDEPLPDLSAWRVAAEARCSGEAEREGLFEAPPLAERAAAADRVVLEAWLEQPRTESALLRMTWLRHPSIEAKRLHVRAALTAYGQLDFLEDTVSRYRGLPSAGTLADQSGKARAAFDRSPKVVPIWVELADLLVAEAWEGLRSEIAARAGTLIVRLADLRFTESEIASLDEHLALLSALEETLEAEVVAGRSAQADLLELKTIVERHRQRRRARESERRHRILAVNECLHRHGDRPLPDLPAEPSAVQVPDVDRLSSLAIALALDPELRRAMALNRRARLALRHFEATTDVTAHPELREELRLEVERTRAEHRRRASELGLQCSRLHTDVVNAVDRVASLEERLIPLAKSRYESLRGGYAGNRARFADLLDAARSVIDRDHELAAARRDLQQLRGEIMRLSGQR
ncbi:MAG: TolC family protein [Planctomycetes bacterium]|nr:TolC family protein [Planctomycetota bacterium]